MVKKGRSLAAARHGVKSRAGAAPANAITGWASAAVDGIASSVSAGTMATVGTDQQHSRGGQSTGQDSAGGDSGSAWRQCGQAGSTAAGATTAVATTTGPQQVQASGPSTCATAVRIASSVANVYPTVAG